MCDYLSNYMNEKCSRACVLLGLTAYDLRACVCVRTESLNVYMIVCAWTWCFVGVYECMSKAWYE